MGKVNKQLIQRVFELKYAGYSKEQIIWMLEITEEQFSKSQSLREDRIKEKAEKSKVYSIKAKQKSSAKPFSVLIQKVKNFQKQSNCPTPFTYQDVLAKFGPNPFCYLTGDPIDYEKGSEYHLEHIIPVNKNGTSDLGNLQLAKPLPNMMKRDIDLNTFISLCTKIAQFNK